MQNEFTPGWVWAPSTRTTNITLVAPEQNSFAPKVANNSMNSFHLVGSVFGQPAYLQVKCTKIADMYENTGINPTSQMPSKMGRRADLTFYGVGADVVTQGTLSKEYLVPLGLSVSFWVPEAYLDSDAVMNSTFTTILSRLILGSLLRPATPDQAGTHLDFMQVLKGVLNLPAVLPAE